MCIRDSLWTVTDRMEYVRETLELRNGTVSFQTMMREAVSKLQMVVTFLAMLEMMKLGEIFVSQKENFGEIVLVRQNRQEG